MKVHALLLLLGAALVAATSEPVVDLPPPPDDESCIGTPEDGRWRKDCNWCSCRNGRATCTRKLCPQGSVDDEPQCEGNPTWKDDCNTCQCADGKAVCTAKHCDVPGPPAPQVTHTVTVVGQECEDGSRWRNECNWCTCEGGRSHCAESECEDWNEDEAREEGIIECHGTSRWKKDCNWCNCANGLGMCTKRACMPPERKPFHGLPEDAVCVPGSRWKMECNWCSCMENGASFCTLMGCLPGFRDDGPTCENGSVWKNDDCNICRCVDGVSACTKRLCREEDPFHRLPENATCVPGSRWKKECNWCSCGETGIAGCTLRGCLPGFRDDGPTCEDGSVWKNDDCNICRCVDGVSACTKRLCRPQQPASTSPQVIPVPEGAECQGVSGTDRWRQDCNWCNCRNGVGACTRRLCREGVKDEGPECEGTPSWMKDCNHCHCVNGRAVCTTKFCGPLPPRPGPGKTLPRPECQGDQEGDFWTKDCNRCRCRNGISACTRRLCRPSEDSSPVCGGSPSWKNDCNYCHCNNGTVLCTTKFCSSPVRPHAGTRRVQVTNVKTNDNPVCEDGSRWRVGCNWCSCHGGIGVCTLKACLDQSAQSDEPECEGDATWKQDCNWCTCGDGLALCTRMACHEPSEKPCIEGKSWKKDCNICRCSQGFVLCTKRACLKSGRELQCQGDSCQPRPPSQLPELCNLPSVRGPLQCTAFFRKWSFSATHGACQQIVYGGCGGTANLFDSQRECETACPSNTITQTRRTSPAGRKAPLGQERCHLPQESGPCFAAFPRYAYNAANGLCEEFIYGGCEGNANNFETQEECLAACRESQKVVTCDKSKCPWPLWEHYLAKECVPVYAGDTCCPISFQCPSASESGKNQTQCHYRGVSYNVRDSVPVAEPCSASCYCSEPYIPGGPSEIHCANVECPDLFRPPTPGCRPLYRADQCCAYDHECVDADTPPLQLRSASCSWLNKTYQEGSKMYFDDYPCQACICGPDFTDPTGPGCYKIDCGFDFRYTSEYHRGCTPIHFELDSCCPIEFLCPDDAKIKPLEQQQQQQQQPDTVDESAVCHLGERRLAVGEILGLTDCKIECRCMTPPELTCIQFRSCELAQETAAKRACQPLECASGCHPVLGGPEECPTCSCSPDTFSCPAQTCPSNCQPELDLQTGCPSCKCKCPEVVCPTGCPSHTVLDEATGCPRCVCKPGTVRALNPEDCPVYPGGEVPCPLDCAIIRKADENGCEVCECDPNNTDTPFGRPLPPGPNLQGTTCRTLPDGRAPCPMDCAIRRRTDENGCEVCECDPDNTISPFGRPPPPNPNLQDTTCRTLPDGQAPCPMDCAIRRRRDENGCEVCECDPDNTISLFGRPPPPNPNLQGITCPTSFDGRAPCPMDCAVIRRTDENGCEVCECDPHNPGNPFGPPPRPFFQHRVRRSWSCPGKWEADCPLDCGVVRKQDANGCWTCTCDLRNPGNPFRPYGPPPRPFW